MVKVGGLPQVCGKMDMVFFTFLPENDKNNEKGLEISVKTFCRFKGTCCIQIQSVPTIWIISETAYITTKFNVVFTIVFSREYFHRCMVYNR